MIENSEVVFIYAESAVHAGDGASTGTVDLPIQRDPQTGFPILRYGGVKGAIRDACRTAWDVAADAAKKAVWETIFGPDTKNASAHAGAAIFTDARLLLFPVRSLRGVTAWITCPLALAYFRRDLARARKGEPFVFPTTSGEENEPVEEEAAPVEIENVDGKQRPQLPTVPGEGAALVTLVSRVTLEEVPTSGAVLEEFHFATEASDEVRKIAEWLAKYALPAGDVYDFWRKRLWDGEASHLILLSDDDFTYFVRHATNVVQRINVNHDTGTVNRTGLWTEESLPGDSLLYTPVHFRPPHRKDAPSEAATPAKMAARLKEALSRSEGLLQIGGNETVGHGLVRVRFLEGTTPDASAGGEPDARS